MYLATGFIDGISGGGGLIALPALLLAGLPADLALGTNKLAVVLGTAASLSTYVRSGLVVRPLVRVGVPVAVVAALIGSAAIMRFDSAGIGRLIVFLLPAGIAATLFPKKNLGGTGEITARRLYVAAPLVCAVLGLYDGFFGPGSGSFFTLAFHCALGLGLLQAAATTKMFNLSTAIIALLVFMWHGKVLYLLGIPLSAANIAGNYLGSVAAVRIGAGFVRTILIFSLTLLFASLIWKFYIG